MSCREFAIILAGYTLITLCSIYVADAAAPGGVAGFNLSERFIFTVSITLAFGYIVLYLQLRPAKSAGLPHRFARISAHWRWQARRFIRWLRGELKMILRESAPVETEFYDIVTRDKR